MPHPGPTPATDIGLALGDLINSFITLSAMRGQPETLQSIGRRAGVNGNAIGKLINGRGDRPGRATQPQYATVIGILRAIGMTHDDLEKYMEQFGRRRGRRRSQDRVLPGPDAVEEPKAKRKVGRPRKVKAE